VGLDADTPTDGDDLATDADEMAVPTTKGASKPTASSAPGALFMRFSMGI
jgi:hypothetical protein